MSDFSIQFIESSIPSNDLDVDFTVSVGTFAKAFLVPAMSPMQSAGIGRSDAAHEDSLASALATANLIDADTIRFIDHSLGFINNLVGIHLVEYTGPVGGVNEVIVRGVVAFGGTAAQIDSGAIAGIVDINKCVPFVTMGGALNSGAWSSHAGIAQVVFDGANNVVRVNKTNGTNQLDVVAYVVEFVGSNWTVQKETHNYAVSNTNEDEAINAVVLANTFVYTTFRPTNNLPRDNNHNVWLSSTTNLRHRLRGAVGASSTAVSYIISNPQLSVQVIGPDPDGTADLAANLDGVFPEVRDLAITEVSNPNQCLVLGFAGDDTNAASQRASVCTMFSLLNNTTVRLRRSNSQSGTEYKIQIIDFTNVIGLSITNVTQLIDGQNFTITGNFGALTGDGVTLDGVVQTAVSANSTEIVRTAVLGTLKYGPHTLVVTAGGTISVPDTFISPPATKNFVDLGTLVTSGQRITATPDLAPGDQLEWSLVVGGTINDVTVATDGSFSASVGVTAFTVRVNDGTGWGTTAVQTVEDVPADDSNLIRLMVTDSTRLISFALTNIEHDT